MIDRTCPHGYHVCRKCEEAPKPGQVLVVTGPGAVAWQDPPLCLGCGLVPAHHNNGYCGDECWINDGCPA